MSSLKSKDGLPIMSFASSSAWEEWLAAQPRTSNGVWLKLAKKHSEMASVSKQQAIDGALCHGWIDGQLQKFDEQCWLVRFTPRLARSKWSAINQARVLQLIDEGRVTAAGMGEVSRARTDGRWEAAYAPQSKAEVPDDLQHALDKNPNAARFFKTLNSANRYAILYRIHDAKKPETRSSRITKFVQMLARGESLHPAKPRK